VKGEKKRKVMGHKRRKQRKGKESVREECQRAVELPSTNSLGSLMLAVEWMMGMELSTDDYSEKRCFAHSTADVTNDFSAAVVAQSHPVGQLPVRHCEYVGM
jgi:hypothetical protein